MHILTNNNKCQRWDWILCGCGCIKYIHVVHDLNSLDAYTLHTVHDQDWVVARHKSKTYMCAIAHVLYST